MSRPKPAGYRIAPFRGKYAVVWYDQGGKRQRRSLGADDLATARTRLGEFIALQERAAKPNRVTVGAILTGYQSARASASSPGAIKYAVQALQPHFGYLLPEHVTKGACETYQKVRQAQGRKLGTIRNELGVLATALTWAKKEKWIEAVPLVPRPGAQPAKERWLSPAEFARVYGEAKLPHVRLFLLLAIFTAGRMTAILDLTWERISLESKLIDLRNPDSTGRRKGRAIVPIKSAMLMQALTEAKEGALTPFVIEWGGTKVGNIWKGIKAASERAGVEGVSPHVLRHTAAVWMRKSGESIENIGQYLGHTDLRVTQKHYAHHAPDFLEGAAAALDRLVSGSLSGSVSNAA